MRPRVDEAPSRFLRLSSALLASRDAARRSGWCESLLRAACGVRRPLRMKAGRKRRRRAVEAVRAARLTCGGASDKDLSLFRSSSNASTASRARSWRGARDAGGGKGREREERAGRAAPDGEKGGGCGEEEVRGGLPLSLSEGGRARFSHKPSSHFFPPPAQCGKHRHFHRPLGLSLRCSPRARTPISRLAPLRPRKRAFKSPSSLVPFSVLTLRLFFWREDFSGSAPASAPDTRGLLWCTLFSASPPTPCRQTGLHLTFIANHEQKAG
jgi:hypothetical protein